MEIWEALNRWEVSNGKMEAILLPSSSSSESPSRRFAWRDEALMNTTGSTVTVIPVASEGHPHSIWTKSRASLKKKTKSSSEGVDVGVLHDDVVYVAYMVYMMYVCDVRINSTFLPSEELG